MKPATAGKAKVAAAPAPPAQQPAAQASPAAPGSKQAAKPAAGSATSGAASRPGTGKGAPPYLQAKLAVSQPQDAAEREADQTARAVMQQLQPGAVNRPHQPGAPTRLFRQAQPVQQPKQRPRQPAQPPSPGPAPQGRPASPPQARAQPAAAQQHAPQAVEDQVGARRASGAGTALPEALRLQLQQRLGADLSAVRIHTDSEAATLCRRMNARAFTVGADIYFAAGAWDPGSDAGLELLSHELTHVLQQGATAGAPQDLALQRDASWSWPWEEPDAPSDPLAPLRERLQQAQAWADAGPYPAAPQTMVGAGGIGGFDAQYLPEPAAGHGTLAITQGVAVSFNDTLVDNGGVIQPHPSLPAGNVAIAALATRIQALPRSRRSRALAAYQWTTAEQGPWLTRATAVVEAAWSGRHGFFLNLPQWNWLGAEVRLCIDMGARAQAATDHMAMQTYKLPTNVNLSDFGIKNELSPGSSSDARDQSLRVGSTTLDPNAYNLLRRSVHFARGSSSLTPAITSELDDWVIRYNGAPGHVAHQDVPIRLVGHTSAAGSPADNMALAQARIDAVQQYLGTHGFTNAATRLTPVPLGEAQADQRHPNSAADQRVDIEVDGAAHQVVISHEFGHALGLDDEYGSGGPGGTAGNLAAHDAWTRDMTRADGTHLPGAVVERNGGIMASGNDVRPQHYSVFHHALQTITGRSPWALGVTVPKWRVQMDCGVPAILNDRPPAAPTDPLGRVPVAV